MIETHISWVFLTGSFAYKVKKPVELPFVDFSSLQARHLSCDDEIRLNRRLAPSLYLGVVSMGGDPPRIGGTPPIEYAVKMRQFDPDARLDERMLAGDVDADAMRRFAQTIAEFHRGLPSVSADRSAAAAAPEIDSFLGNLSECQSMLGASGSLQPARDWLDARQPRLEQLLAARRAGGFVRDCHGDLHLENLVLLGGEITAFDALEFSEKLRAIDVADEVGFLTMDCIAHDRADLGHVFLNRYLEITGDYDGLRLIDFYMLHRALVRAKVRAIRAEQSRADGKAGAVPYLHCARHVIESRNPSLLVTRGLSGSGKTRIAQELVARLPAISVRSDLERKRLFGLAADAESHSGVSSGIYSQDASARTYRVLERAADAALESKLDVIVDAAFLEHSERAAFAALARRRQASFLILDCRAPEDVLRSRIAKRKAERSDASEATADVLDHQLATQEPLSREELEAAIPIDTGGPVDADAIRRSIERRAGASS